MSEPKTKDGTPIRVGQEYEIGRGGTFTVIGIDGDWVWVRDREDKRWTWLVEVMEHATLVSDPTEPQEQEFDASKLPSDDFCQATKELAEPKRIEPQEQKPPALNRLASKIHKLNHKWWHDKDGNRLERNKGELLCLIHSEISEAMEGERKDLMDDHLPHRKMAEVELADALIRILDYASGFGYDLDGAVCDKLAYNAKRTDHTYEDREKENGKKW